MIYRLLRALLKRNMLKTHTVGTSYQCRLQDKISKIQHRMSESCPGGEDARECARCDCVYNCDNPGRKYKAIWEYGVALPF